MSRHDAADVDARKALVARIAEQVVRHVLDLRIPHLDAAAEAAAYRVLVDPDIAAGLRATAALTALDARHQPRTWVGGHTVVCVACETAWPCPDRELIDAAQTPARPGRVPAGPSGPQAPAAVQVGEALPAAGHHPDADGNRCRNCNARLRDAEPYCDAGLSADDLAALRAINGPVVSANDGECVCGASDEAGPLFDNPDPWCGVGTHRLDAQKLGRTR